MNHQSISFRRSTPMERNDGTMPEAERSTERISLKAIASAALQRNASRNDCGTARNEALQSFRENTPFQIDICGEYTPYCPAIPVALVHELHQLIAEYAKQFKYTEVETQRLIATAKRQPLSTVPESILFFKRANSHTT